MKKVGLDHNCGHHVVRRQRAGLRVYARQNMTAVMIKPKKLDEDPKRGQRVSKWIDMVCRLKKNLFTDEKIEYIKVELLKKIVYKPQVVK